jgi:hypothetical protein
MRIEILAPTSESLDVVLNPLKGKTLVAQTKVEFSRLLELLTTTQKSPSTKAIVDADTDDWLPNLDRVLNDEREVVTLINATAHVVASAVDPERNRQVLLFAASRTDNVEVQAVLGEWVAPLIRPIAVALSAVSTMSDPFMNTDHTSLEYCVAGFAPCQVAFKGAGTLNRRSPTGGCAYGIPRK